MWHNERQVCAVRVSIRIIQASKRWRERESESEKEKMRNSNKNRHNAVSHLGWRRSYSNTKHIFGHPYNITYRPNQIRFIPSENNTFQASTKKTTSSLLECGGDKDNDDDDDDDADRKHITFRCSESTLSLWTTTSQSCLAVFISRFSFILFYFTFFVCLEKREEEAAAAAAAERWLKWAEGFVFVHTPIK